MNNKIRVLKGEHKNKLATLKNFTGGGHGLQGEKHGTVYATLDDGTEISLKDDGTSYRFLSLEVESKTMTKELFKGYESREFKLQADMIYYPSYGLLEHKSDEGWTFWWIQDSVSQYSAPSKDTKVLESWTATRPFEDELPPVMRGNKVGYELHELFIGKDEGCDTLGIPGYVLFLGNCEDMPVRMGYQDGDGLHYVQ